ncbi:MAG: hypothetical protein ACKPJJ_26790, partial [Planctomycetaceae bacterium]
MIAKAGGFYCVSWRPRSLCGDHGTNVGVERAAVNHTEFRIDEIGGSASTALFVDVLVYRTIRTSPSNEQSASSLSMKDCTLSGLP